MKTIDRYVVRSFLFSVLMWFFVMMSMRIVIDLFVNMDEFTEHGSSATVVFTQAMKYYSIHSLVYFTELGGVIIIASAAFTVAMLNHTNELTAMLASGISLHRVVLPIIIIAVLLGGFIVLDYELLIPKYAHMLVLPRDFVPEEDTDQVSMVTDGARSVWYGGMFNPAEKRISRIVVVVLRDPNAAWMGVVAGTAAKHDKLEHKWGWWFENGRLKTPAGLSDRAGDLTCEKIWTHLGPKRLLEEIQKKGEQLDADKIIGQVEVQDDKNGLAIQAARFEPDPKVPIGEGGSLINVKFTVRMQQRHVATFLAKRAVWTLSDDGEPYWALTGGRMFHPSDLTPNELLLRRSVDWVQFMSISKLTQLLRLDRGGNREAAELNRHVRVTEPINNIVMLLLGLPFILSRQRNIKTSVTLCVLICILFYTFIYICRYMGLPPALAAWLPILLFGPVAAVLYDSVKT